MSNQNTDSAQEQKVKSDTADVAVGNNGKNELSVVEETADGSVAVNGKPSVHSVGHDTEQHHSHET